MNDDTLAAAIEDALDAWATRKDGLLARVDEPYRHELAVELADAVRAHFARHLAAAYERLQTIEGQPTCHCGQPVTYGYDGDPTHHRGLCSRCDDVRCDAFPGACQDQ